MNAIANKNTPSLKGCTIYCILFPCNKCAQLIIQSGIKKVVYYSDKKAREHFTKSAKELLIGSKVGIRYDYKNILFVLKNK